MAPLRTRWKKYLATILLAGSTAVIVFNVATNRPGDGYILTLLALAGWLAASHRADRLSSEIRKSRLLATARRP